eukprot:TRINITY_DN827_c0_g3_i4.p1 TRINITY_DN827_c0_g3~~TRINITY_DN827_c0_g3_i4.p1  ORF type:complete len:916 (-),score=215.95 TRINITY_DN827_c0_g3_i4:105-2852(-)
MRQRRERARQWQLMKAAELENQKTQEPEETADAKKREWSLEDESDGEENEGKDEGPAKTITTTSTSAISKLFSGDDDMDEESSTTSGPAWRRKSTISRSFMTSKAEEPAPEQISTSGPADAEDEVDPLDAFMNDLYMANVPAYNTPAPASIVKEQVGAKSGQVVAKPAVVDEEDDEEEPATTFEDIMKDLQKKKRKELPKVDHSTIRYAPFRKSFYIEAKEIASMTPEEVESYRKELGEIKIRGKDCPNPVKTWAQCGLSSKVLEALKKNTYPKPTPIQAQAIPAIMSGRDVIACAKTGSGKTLAFVLPMTRHVLDQPDLEANDGPIALVIAPTRELALQIYTETKKFCKALNLVTVCCYGGAGVANQIGDLKRGAHIVVCTPGRMIDILSLNNGKVTNLRRVTYLVLDEADRMFDMGFEPQITRIIENIRPDRQTVLFSATFPRQVEQLAKHVLTRPLEIIVGGRSVVCSDVEQHVEVIEEDDKFIRLLQLLGEHYMKGNILIFVDRQEKADQLFRELLKAKYPCQSLHGGMDQMDRDLVLSDFKNGEVPLMIATSVAARGLDVKELNLVVNYQCPNHLEDYVHRVGRTGRAGRKGASYTFITPDEDTYAPDLVTALEQSNTAVPEDLKKLSEAFLDKKKQGLVKAHSSGYGGKGFKFDEEEADRNKTEMKRQAKGLGLENELDDNAVDEAEEERLREAADTNMTADENEALSLMAQAMMSGADATTAAAAAAAAVSVAPTPAPMLALPAPMDAAAKMRADMIAEAAKAAGIIALPPVVAETSAPTDAIAKAQALAAQFKLQEELIRKHQGEASKSNFESEIEINDYPQQARWKVTHKDAITNISELTGAAITTRGSFVPPNKNPPPGERKLYLVIEGPTEASVKMAKTEIQRILYEVTATVGPERHTGGKYTV